MRIYEFAKQKNVSSKELVEILIAQGFDVTSHMSVLNTEAEAFLNKKFGKKAEPVAPKKVALEEKAPAASVKKAPAKKAAAESIPTPPKKPAPAITPQPTIPLETPLSPVTSQTKIEKNIPQQASLAPHGDEAIELFEVADALETEGVTAPQASYIRAIPRGARTSAPRADEQPRRQSRSRRNYQRRLERRQQNYQAIPVAVTEITLKGDLPLDEAAAKLGKLPGELILSLLKKGMVCNKNNMLTAASIADLAHQYGIKVISEGVGSTATGISHVSKEIAAKGAQRWPMVVVIGHVDHGKTTLLDYIRKANVAGKEKGGITQHLGAYEVETPHGKIVFLDTPGHEAFTFMRARGIKVTDIAILVVAADDGVMPQTIEAIKSAKEAGVTLVVAINKVDKLGSTAPIESVKRQLSQQDVLVEDWGGTVVCAPISGKTGAGVAELLEMVTLQAQMLDLKADPDAVPRAFVLESKLDKGYGPVATVIPIEGTIRQGDYFVAGEATGKVRLLVNSKGERIKQAGPSIPVQIIGFDKFAPLGEWLHVVPADEYSKVKSGRQKVVSTASSTVLQQASDSKVAGERIIRLLIKVDTNGSREAVNRVIAALAKANKEVARRLQVVSVTVGDISESDVLMAEDIDAYIIGLHVKTERNASVLAKDKKVEIVPYDIIYHLTEGLEALIQDSRKAIIVATKVGEATVRKVFPLKNNTVIAGCYVTDGTIQRNAKVICMRDNKKVGEGKINSLQRDKKTVKEVHSGYECGFVTDNFHEWQVGDIVQCIVETKEMPK
jgi:translation initiation factor IF-2